MTRANWSDAVRLGGLRRFAAAITLITVLGHAWLGFEQAWLHPLVALMVTYGCELALEWIDARVHGRPPAYTRGNWIDFFLPAHITGLAIAMLLYPGARLAPIVFAGVVAIGSKAIFRWSVDGRARHVFNPSNLGITATLLVFPSVGIAPPYQFTEALTGFGDWMLPAVVIGLGSFLNARYTRRWPLIAAWLIGFALQALARHWLLGSAFLPALMPMTGMAFLLFTFYMVTDPPTTPSSVRGQIVFGATVAATYGILMASHVVFGLFFALSITCALHALVLAYRAFALRSTQPSTPAHEAPRAATPRAEPIAPERRPHHARL